MNIAELDIRDLRALVAVVEERGVSRAAARLGVSQPTVSRSLARWRELAGDPVVVRAGRSMEPTPRAVELAERVAALLGELEDAVARQPFVPGQARRTFRLAAWDYVDAVILGPLLSRLGDEAPAASVEVHPWRDRAIGVVMSGQVDLVAGLFRDLGAGCFRRRLFRDRFVTIARADHPRIGKRLSLAAFCDAPHLLVAPFGPVIGAVDRALAARGRSRHVRLVVPDFAGAPDLVRRTDMVATLPERVLAARGGLRVFRPPVELPEFDVELVWHERTHHSPAHRWFRDLVCAAAGPARA